MKNRTIFTQVIGGIYKGKRLKLPSLNTTRSTKSILKESLFNSIAYEIIDKNFIEVFGGSGSVMIEAVSRGAKHGYCIELDKSAYKILFQNCKSINLEKFTCKNADSFKELEALLLRINEESILYLDPPFMYRNNMEKVYEKCFKLLERVDSNFIFLVIFEHASTFRMPKNIGYLNLTKSKKFGKSSLSYFSKSI